MSAILEESGAILETGRSLLDALDSQDCTKCPSRADLVFELNGLDNAAKILKTYACGFDMCEVTGALTRWAGDAREALQTLLKKCEGCRSLPLDATKLVDEQRQLVDSVLV